MSKLFEFVNMGTHSSLRHGNSRHIRPQKNDIYYEKTIINSDGSYLRVFVCAGESLACDM